MPGLQYAKRAAASYAVTVELADVQAQCTAHTQLTRLSRQLNSRQQNPLLRLGMEATDWGIASWCLRWGVATLAIRFKPAIALNRQ